MRRALQFALLLVGLPILGVVGVMAWLKLAGFALFGFGLFTPYCPLSHKHSDTSVCAVLDADGSRLLIQHGDFSKNRNYLEVREGDLSTLYLFPEGLAQFAPRGYSADLIPGSSSEIVINGEKQALKPAN